MSLNPSSKTFKDVFKPVHHLLRICGLSTLSFHNLKYGKFRAFYSCVLLIGFTVISYNSLKTKLDTKPSLEIKLVFSLLVEIYSWGLGVVAYKHAIWKGDHYKAIIRQIETAEQLLPELRVEPTTTRWFYCFTMYTIVIGIFYGPLSPDKFTVDYTPFFKYSAFIIYNLTNHSHILILRVLNDYLDKINALCDQLELNSWMKHDKRGGHWIKTTQKYFKNLCDARSKVLKAFHQTVALYSSGIFIVCCILPVYTSIQVYNCFTLPSFTYVHILTYVHLINTFLTGLLQIQQSRKTTDCFVTLLSEHLGSENSSLTELHRDIRQEMFKETHIKRRTVVCLIQLDLSMFVTLVELTVMCVLLIRTQTER